jgi:hypothetical protein
MKLGSEEHKALFCRCFIDTHLQYEPETLPWPQLDAISLDRLRAIPFWREALYKERNAGMMVNAFAQTIDDPLLREAVSLQGGEENRHARLIEFFLNHYGIKVAEPAEEEIPLNMETAFVDFGFGECLDSFFAFGLFAIARQAQYLPQPLFTIFDPILYEEARHIVFFINWVNYLQIQRGRGLAMLRATHALWHYSRSLWILIRAFRGSGAREEEEFAISGASTFMDDLTPELFISTCLAENTKRMSQFDPHLLRPQFIPRLSKLALGILQHLPGRQKKPALQ